MPDLGRAAKALTRAAASAAKAKGKGAYSVTRFEFSSGLAGAVADYLNDGGRAPRNEARRLAVEKVAESGERGFRDGSGDANAEIVGEDLRALVALQNETLAFIDSLFDSLADLRKQTPVVFPQARVDQFTNSLDAVYSTMKLRGANNPMLVFEGSDGIQNCSTCAKLKGRKQRAKWWVDNNLVPGAGNESYKCLGFNCRHFLATLDGKRFTV